MSQVRVCLCLFCVFLFSTIVRAYSQELPFEQWKDPQPGQFAWLLDFAGKPATAATADPRFAALRDHPLSVLKAQFDLGDPAGGKTLVRDEILSSLNGVPDAVQTRLGRYVLLSGCRDAACTDRVMVWVDTVRGLVLSVLLAPSTADLPGTAPNMLIASRQLDAKRIEPAQLPSRFWVDWQEWAYQRHLPDVMTQRIVNTYGGLSIIFHDDEKMCADAFTTLSAIQCGNKAVNAASADLSALLAQLQAHFAMGSRDRTALDNGQALWLSYRESTCNSASLLLEGGTGKPVMELDCERLLTHERVRDLNDLYYMPLYD